MILNIFKIGGSIVDNDEMLSAFSAQLAKVAGHKIVVHGGGKTATQMCERMGIPVEMHEGRRITDAATLKVVVMIYGGWVNKNVVARLQAEGINATGLTGADGNCILAHKRVNAEIDYGFAGDIDCVDHGYLNLLLDSDKVPVLAPLTHDGKGQLLNTNADTIAASVAGAMSRSYAVRLIYILDHAGVLEDINDPQSALDEIALSEIQTLKNKGVISDGMVPKLHNARAAIENGAKEVYITNVASLDRIGQKNAGTRIFEN